MKQMKKALEILVAVNDSIDVVMKDERFIEQVGERRGTNSLYLPPVSH